MTRGWWRPRGALVWVGIHLGLGAVGVQRRGNVAALSQLPGLDRVSMAL